jgi:hypothetical protein
MLLDRTRKCLRAGDIQAANNAMLFEGLAKLRCDNLNDVCREQFARFSRTPANIGAMFLFFTGNYARTKDVHDKAIIDRLFREMNAIEVWHKVESLRPNEVNNFLKGFETLAQMPEGANFLRPILM